MAEAKKGTAKKAFADIHEGSLKKLGWPNVSTVVGNTNDGNRKKVVQKLLLLANFAADDATKAKARGAINRIKSKLGESGKGK